MGGVLVFLLVVAIFLGAAVVVIRLIPEPYQKWAWAVLVVVGAVLLINWLLGGGLGVAPSPPRVH